jgi:polyphosphate kinase 2 (PPK2 family)
MKKLQAKLNELAESNTRKIAVVLEGRDTAGKSRTIRTVTEYLNPKWYSIVPSTKPSVSAMANWWQWWNNKMPAENQIVFYDRSWYSRAMVQKINYWCTENQYKAFLDRYRHYENVVHYDTRFIKFWLSISEVEQKARIEARKKSPLTYWKFSENDENALSHYDRMTLLKEKVVDANWIVLDYNNKQSGIETFLQKLIEEIEK